MNHSILIVEDDIPLAGQIEEILVRHGFRTRVVHTAEAALEESSEIRPDLYLLDVMVPVMGGWELCRRLRLETSASIIFLTALSRSEDIVKGLHLGADDYITKPFDEEVLLARVAAHLRRRSGELSDRLVFGQGELDIDFARVTVRVRGERVDLTPREYDLLRVLTRHAGQVMRVRQLLVEAWGEEYADATENIKPYIHYLRKKIERDPASPRWIITVRGVGYRFGS